MVYETSRLLAYQIYQHWVSKELFCFGWFLEIIVLTIVYIIWFKLVDKSKFKKSIASRVSNLFGFIIADLVLFNGLGLVEFKIGIFPMMAPIFIVTVTIVPILFMLVQQYTFSWKGYLLWASIGAAVISFGLGPIYTLVGIIQLHNWNYFYQFLLMLTGGILSRAALLWVIGIEQSHPTSK